MRLLLLFSLFPPHLGEWVGFLGAFVCFLCVFWSIGVCVECVFPLSNIVTYRKKFIFIYKLQLQKRWPNPGRKSM